MVRVLILISLVLSLSACGSRMNPLNWFGGEREERVRVDDSVLESDIPPDPRPLVTEITQLSIEQTTSGAIIRATGVTAAQGYFDASLREIQREDGQLVFDFRAAAPQGTPTAGLQEILVGLDVSNGDLAGIRTITVIAQNNRRSVSRR